MQLFPSGGGRNDLSSSEGSPPFRFFPAVVDMKGGVRVS